MLSQPTYRRFARCESGNEALQSVIVLGVAAIVLAGVLDLWSTSRRQTEGLLASLFNSGSNVTSDVAVATSAVATSGDVLSPEATAAAPRPQTTDARRAAWQLAMDTDSAAPPEGAPVSEPSPSGNGSQGGRGTREPQIDPPEPNPPERNPNDPEEGEEEDPEEEDPTEQTRRPTTNGTVETQLAGRSTAETESTTPAPTPAAAVPEQFGGGVPSGGGFPGGTGGLPGSGSSQFANGYPGNGSGFGGNTAPFGSYGGQYEGRNQIGAYGSDAQSGLREFADRSDDKSFSSRKDRDVQRSQNSRQHARDTGRGFAVSDFGGAGYGYEESEDVTEGVISDDSSPIADDVPVKDGRGPATAATGLATNADSSALDIARRDSAHSTGIPVARMWELRIKGIERRPAELPRLVVEMGRPFDQIQIKFADEHLAFGAPTRVPSTNTIPLSETAMTPGTVLSVIGVRGKDRVQAIYEVAAEDSGNNVPLPSSLAEERSGRSAPHNEEW